MKKTKGYDRLKNLGAFAHKSGATKPAGLAKTVKAIKSNKLKKGI